MKYHTSQGRKVNYIPGWDCHGLPIELKALKKGNDIYDPNVTRKVARKFAESNVDKQNESFRSWGILGDWNSKQNTYRTIDKNYILNELKIFQKLYKNNLVYRILKPVHWSSSSRTALAEAELEYDNNFISPSIHLRLRVCEIANEIRNVAKTDEIYALIWTTTPWTLPSNQAISYNPNFEYSLIRFTNLNGLYLIATDLENIISETIGKFAVLLKFHGDILKSAKYDRPLSNESGPFLPGQHVQSSKGTGLVHTAPAHGPDDFLISIDHNINVKCLVDENGDYTKEAPEFLHKKNVLRDGNVLVMNALKSDIIKVDQLQHSYPIDWRTKEPVIFRASKQWFIDTEKIKSIAANEIEKHIEFYPNIAAEVNKKSLLTQVLKRPYWCISRQRSWGVPIPVFYDRDSGEDIVSDEIIEHILKLVDKEGGIDFWWNKSVDEILPQKILNKFGKNLEKGGDIFDIWFDSGTSWASVLDADRIADLYVEGQDQCTGWFQTSLLTSCAVRAKSPYK